MVKRSTQIQSILLDSATTLFVGALYYQYPKFFNPWGFTLLQWILFCLFIRVAIIFYDYLVIFIVEMINFKLLPTRTTEKPVRYVPLDAKSFFFLFLNSLQEGMFVQQITFYIWDSPQVSLDWNDIGLVNTLGALYVMFVVVDVIYAPGHHLLHLRWLYPLIHKHHHRQIYPVRGYLDAGNEHPIEQMVGIGAIWGAVFAAIKCTGAHGLTIFIYFNLHATLAFLNHSPYDVQFNILGIKYSVGNHEMHHRKFTINYAQYCMWYDHLVDTFAVYDAPNPKKVLNEVDPDGEEE